MPSVLVIGNGESRKNLDIKSFRKNYSVVIGCNALHRELAVDHLICCDKRMVEESIISENTHHSQIWVRDDWYKHFRKIRKDKRIFCIPDLPYQGHHKEDKKIHWNSGPSALLVACSLNPTKIDLLGFDLYPTNNKINNIYKGTVNYKDEDSKPVDHSFWKYQIAKVFKYFPSIKFTVINKKEWIMPTDWHYDNVNFLEIPFTSS